MSNGINKVMLIGHLGANPEVITTKTGNKMATFSIATESRYQDKNSGEQIKNVEWHRIVSFGKTARVVTEYVSKGSQLYVEGSLQTRKWTDKKGSDRYTTEIIEKNIVILSSKTSVEAIKPGIEIKNDVVYNLEDFPWQSNINN